MSLKSFFDENGYVTVDNVFTHAEMDELMARVDGMERREIPYPESDVKWEPANPSALRNAFGLLHRDPAFRSVATHPELASVVEQILGPDLDIYADGLFAKPALDGGLVPPHQDMYYWSFQPFQDAHGLDRLGGCDPPEWMSHDHPREPQVGPARSRAFERAREYVEADPGGTEHSGG